MDRVLSTKICNKTKHDEVVGAIQWNPAITKYHGTEKIVRYSGVFVIAKTPL